VPEDAPTRKIATVNPNAPVRLDENGDALTVYYRGGRELAQVSTQQNDVVQKQDPPAAWLVVVTGPGKGQCLMVIHGANSLGRGAGSRIRMDFGDQRIARYQHAVVTYDPMARQFHLQNGGGRQLTYLNGQPVLTPQHLRHGDHIKIGATTLRFIAVCGEDFDWTEWDD